MGIAANLESWARKNTARVGVGVGGSFEDAKIIEEAALLAGDYAEAVMVKSEQALVTQLKNGQIDAAVRGTLKAANTLNEVKKAFDPDVMSRACLIDCNSREFFLTPVGIDEGWTVSEKVFAARGCAGILRGLDIDPKAGVLAGGRAEDMWRNPVVDETLKEAQEVTDALSAEMTAVNYHILIEDALEDGANIIIPPNGLLGNYIFRTMVLAAGQKSFGAPLLGIESVFIDTSRANTPEGYARAIMTASGLCEFED
jgi:putative methanogen marker protein 4